MAYSFRIASSQYIEQGGFLYVRPTSPSTSSLDHWSNSASYFWMYNSVGGTLEVSDTYGKNAQSSATTLYFSTDSTIEVNNHRYEFYCTAQLHETTPELNGYTSQNTRQVITANGGSYYYFYTKIYRLVNTKITITFNANGGSVSPSSVSEWGGTSITLPTPTYNASHSFTGWYYNNTLVGYGGDSWTVPTGTGDITLKAHWSTTETGNITCACIHGTYVIGTYSYSQDDDSRTASMSWNITRTTVIENGITFTFARLRILYYPYNEVVPRWWHTDQTSGTFDQTSVSPRPDSMFRPPDVRMLYYGDSLLRSRTTGWLIYHKTSGNLCYGPAQYTVWCPDNRPSGE